MTKVQKIWAFILFNNPTRKELTCYILGIKKKDWNPSNRGHYGTNIAEWKRKGHIEVIDKQYHITKNSLKSGDGRMYVALPKTKDEIHQEHIEVLTEERDIYRAEWLYFENLSKKLQNKLNKINSISNI